MDSKAGTLALVSVHLPGNQELVCKERTGFGFCSEIRQREYIVFVFLFIMQGSLLGDQETTELIFKIANHYLFSLISFPDHHVVGPCSSKESPRWLYIYLQDLTLLQSFWEELFLCCLSTSMRSVSLYPTVICWLNLCGLKTKADYSAWSSSPHLSS